MAAGLKSVFRTANKVNDVLLPQFENLKQRKLGKSAYAIYVDYKTVFVDVVKVAKIKPFKTALGLGTLSSLFAVYRNNPDEQSYIDTLLDNANDLLQIGEMIRNPNSDKYIQEVLKLHYMGRLQRQSFGLISLMMLPEFSKDCDLYGKHCYYTKTRWMDLWRQVIDIGMFGHWYHLENMMTDYDVNAEEMADLPDDTVPQNSVLDRAKKLSDRCIDTIQDWFYSLKHSIDNW